MRLSKSSLVAALATCIGLSLAACSSGNGGGPNAGCPSSPPTAGTTCFVNGTTCNYDTPQGNCGGGLVAVCSNGTWSFEATAQPGLTQACPATIPAPGTACSQSYCGAQPSCSYGCDQGGPAYATCNGSTWQVTREGVGCAADAGDGGDAAEGGTSCHAQTDCGTAEYCQTPGGPYLTGFALGSGCSSDAACAADAGAGAPWCNGGACVCQSTQYAPRPQPGLQAQGFCMPPCAKNADCAASPLAPLYGDGTGFVCGSGGHCVPKPCSTPSECPAGFDCAANQCVRRSCTADTDCAPSGACVDGACYPSAGTCQGLPA